MPFSVSAQKLFVEDSDLSPKLVDSMYVKGLRYLVKTQNEKGHWDAGRYGTEPAVVGLAIHSAGLLYTFGCLVLPALTARNLCREVRPMFWVAPTVALSTALVGFPVAHAAKKTVDYSPPMVEHRAARERAIRSFRTALGRGRSRP